MPTPSNRLASQASPYLARHAAHPVDWYPWGAEAFTAAQARDCPILLSIGDATSPPCRVLEREHLENEQLAERMNRQYVNIKVDRETRPDLDMLYRTAAKALLPDCSEWPVAVFLTPDGAPFHAGVLVSSAHGQDHYSFPLLDHVDLAWRTQRADLAQVASGIRDVLKRSMLPPPLCSAQNDWTRTVAEHDLPRKKAPEQAERDAPKHPSHGVLSALLVEWHLRRAPRVRTRITRALHEAQTETHDWLAGGFVHPSRPVEGAAPLLIKGLDENAALAALYANAARAFGSAQWAQVAIETCEFVRRALQLESGGVCTAIEIDPGLEDGRCFAWTLETVCEALGPVDGPQVAKLLGVPDSADRPHGLRLLHPAPTPEPLPAAHAARLARARPLLAAHQRQRIHAARSPLVITTQCALMIRAWAVTGAAFDRPALVAAAVDAARFVESQLVCERRLHRSWRAGNTGGLAYADDHAALAWAYTHLYEATGDPHWLARAAHWAHTLVNRFWDPEDGGLYYTAQDAEPLLVRPRVQPDSSTFSGGAMAAIAFSRLEHFLGLAVLGARAHDLVRHFQAHFQTNPLNCGLEAVAAAWRTAEVAELALFGEFDDPVASEMRRTVAGGHHPFLLLAPVDARHEEQARRCIPWLAERGPRNGRPRAFLCVGTSCRIPARNAEALERQLAGLNTQAAPKPPSTTE